VPESYKESWKDEVGYRGILPHLYANRRTCGSGGFPYFRTPCSHPIPSLKEPTCIGEGPHMGGLPDLRLSALEWKIFGRPS